jgi:poly(3-hydroxybutyrate) depolymerase
MPLFPSSLAALLLTLSFGSLAAPPPLPALNIDIRESSVSGISSGGFMSAQLQIAHSSIIKGAGIVAGGPYYCSQDNVVTATTRCTCTGEPLLDCAVSATSAAVPDLVSSTRTFFERGLIDDPANIARQRVVTLSGGQDPLVPAPVTAQLHEYYRNMGLPPQNLKPVTLEQAGHTMPTIGYGGDCATTAEPFIGKCSFDSAEAMLSWIYGPDSARARTDGEPRGRFIEFDQRPYIPKDDFSSWFSSLLSSNGLDTTGWLYVPETCASGAPCRLHVALHGCKQGQSYVPLQPPPGGGLHYGTTFVRNTGYDRWADTNNLVVLFPQAVSIPGKNPNGCWDWWGYTDGHYADRKGVQIRAIRAMMDRLSSGMKP